MKKLLPKSIIDTSVLLSLYHLELLDFLNLLYEEVLIPTTVENEFLSIKDEAEKTNRLKLLNNFYELKPWIKKCNNYNTDSLILLLTKLDRGEAEAFAQNQVFHGTYELLIDEKKGRNYAQGMNYKYRGTLSILARIDLRLKGCDYYKCVEKLKTSKINRFSEKIIKDVYQKEKEYLLKAID